MSLNTEAEGYSRKTDAVTGPRSALESWSAMSKTRSFALGTAKGEEDDREDIILSNDAKERKLSCLMT